MIRALHVLNDVGTGGAETLVLRLCRLLPENGVEARVASLLGPRELGPAFAASGIAVDYLSAGRRLDPRALGRLVGAIRRNRIDVVHTHLVYAGIIGKIAAEIAGRPAIATRHYACDSRERLFRFRLEDHLNAHYARRLVAIESAMAAELAERRIMPADRIVVLRNGIDLAPYACATRSERSSGRPLVGTIGRLVWEKAHEVFLAAIAIVRDAVPAVRGEIWGYGRREGEIMRERDRLRLAGVVEMPGRAEQDEIPRILGTFDVFVLSSDSEGMPMTLIEAAAAGVPIVTTDVGGAREVVIDGETGFIVPRRDPRALADAILRLLRDPNLRALMGDAARTVARERFDIRILARDTAALYRTVLAER